MRSTLALLAACFATSALAARDYTVIDLGTLGGPGSYGAAIANDGTVVGCADVTVTAAHAFVWKDGVMRDLGAGSDAAGSSCALAVNKAGLVAGRASSGELVTWSASGVTSLGVKGDIGSMNDAGTIVGAAKDGTTTRAFVYANGALQTLQPLDGTGSSAATGINHRGDVVGRSGSRAFLFTSNTLADLGPGSARDINDRGTIVGQGSSANAQPVAVVYGRDAMPQSLEAPAYSTAIALNNGGQVVGSGEGIYGWVLDDGVYTRLADVPGVASAGYRRVEPTGINDKGWIVATASNAEGNLRALLLVPAGSSSTKALRLVEGK